VTRNHQGRQGRLTATETDFDVVRQRAMLVGTGADIGLGAALADDDFDEGLDDGLDELARLVDTAGADVVDRAIQRRNTPDPATYIGSGKAHELYEICEALDVDLVVFDDELSPAQQRNLEKLFKRDVVDRVALILDIFAQHATSQEGIVQVELAQLRYMSPRLRGRGIQLSQQVGGIGAGRGPGETKLEIDRRRIGTRISKLERDLRTLGETRATQRKSRRRSALSTVALVGYTNAGKSTLLNRVTAADVLVENRLFSTLDPTTRRMPMPGGETVLISDTVGFVRKLPHQLVEAFRSTLEEVLDARLLLHVIDGSARDVEEQIVAVRSVLAEIGAGDLPEQIVINKADLIPPETLAALQRLHPDAVVVSAATGVGIPELLQSVGDRLRALDSIVELIVPLGRGDVLAALHREGEVLVEVFDSEAARVTVRLPQSGSSRYREFLTA
jgi:GTP-binding protein HflX